MIKTEKQKTKKQCSEVDFFLFVVVVVVVALHIWKKKSIENQLKINHRVCNLLYN